MYSDSVIDLTAFLPAVPGAKAASPRRKNRHTSRRNSSLLTAIEAAVTVCIGLGFLVCLGLVFTML